MATMAQGQNITDRKEAEAELLSSKEQLSRSKEHLELEGAGEDRRASGQS